MVTYLEEAMEPNISFFIFLRSANEAFPAWVVSISTNVARLRSEQGYLLGQSLCRS